MKYKTTFWAGMGYTILGIINLILFVTLTKLGVVMQRSMAYLFVFGFFPVVWLPYLFERFLHVKFSLIVVICFNTFMIFSMLLGSLWRLFIIVPNYDKVIHFLSGILFSVLGYDLYKSGKMNKSSLIWLFLITFSFSMMCGGVWEIYEFTADAITNGNAQVFKGLTERSALNDTMLDLVSDCVGAVIGGIIAVLLEKFKNKKNTQE